MNKKIVGTSILFMLLCIGLFVCTIKEDLGSAVGTGPGTQPPDTTQQTVPEDSTGPVTLFVSHDQFVMLGDTLTVTVSAVRDSVYPSTRPYSNLLVIVSTTTGWISAESLTTNSSGVAQFSCSDTVERDNVTITLASMGQTWRSQFKVTNTPDQLERNVRALPDQPSIKADAVDNTLIRVTVIDSNHNPIVGEAVQFVSTAGVISGSSPPEESLSGQSLTDASGVATATLRSSNINDTAYITVYLVNNMSMNDVAQVAFQGVALSLVAQVANLTPDSQTIVTATLRNASSVPIAKWPIYFNLGRGSSSNLTLLEVDSVTGFDGTARVTVRGDSNGSDSIEVRAAGARSNIKINVTSLILTAELNSGVLQADADYWDTLHVTFKNHTGSALVSKQVRLIRYFQTSAGAPLADTAYGTTSSAGKHDFPINALPYEGTMRLEVTGYNSSTDIATAETEIEFIATRNITMYALPTVILADGTSKSQITVQIKNKLNNPIVDDDILFTCRPAGLIPASAKTDGNGRAVVSLTSDRRNTTTTVIATFKTDPTVTDSVQVEFTGVGLSASASPPSINSDGTDTSLIVASLVDANNNPIVGETVYFSKQQTETRFVEGDSSTQDRTTSTVTDNRGEAYCKVIGQGSGQDTIGAKAAGATANAVLYYSSNSLRVDTIPANGTIHSYVANGTDSTRITVTYEDGSGTAIANAYIEASVTLGDIPSDSGVVFADTLRTNSSGIARFYIVNPNFANWATIQIKAITGTEVTSARQQIYFKADLIDHIQLTGTPEVVSTNGDRAKITAVAFDAQNNRVKDATIAFNLLNGPGGGEYVDPPTATTNEDGTASSYLVSGPLPSNFREVWIAAGDFTAIKSDTVRLTIAGPPAYITIRRQIGEISKNGDATYSKVVSAIVTDINGNPVADGTEVTFGAKITGFMIYRLVETLEWYGSSSTYADWGYYYYDVDTVGMLLPFEDLNDNFSGANPEPGEDRSRDGYANRGEDVNGDGVFQPGPGFFDIDWNGVRNPNPEPYHIYYRYYYDTSGVRQGRIDTAFADHNGNGVLDLVEGYRDASMTDSIYQSMAGYDPTLQDGYGGYPDIDWNMNGVPDPSTAVTIERTVTTVAGIAENKLTYGQSDAWRIQVRLTAEAQGKVAASPEEFVLPILLDDVPYWSYRDNR